MSYFYGIITTPVYLGYRQKQWESWVTVNTMSTVNRFSNFWKYPDYMIWSRWKHRVSTTNTPITNFHATSSNIHLQWIMTCMTTTQEQVTNCTNRTQSRSLQRNAWSSIPFHMNSLPTEITEQLNTYRLEGFICIYMLLKYACEYE